MALQGGTTPVKIETRFSYGPVNQYCWAQRNNDPKSESHSGFSGNSDGADVGMVCVLRVRVRVDGHGWQ